VSADAGRAGELPLRDPGHLRWVWDIAHHSAVCLAMEGATKESIARSA
jgi:hypothetical protein